MATTTTVITANNENSNTMNNILTTMKESSSMESLNTNGQEDEMGLLSAGMDVHNLSVNMRKND
uniref:Uncharacterized protein n=1 Tax=Romanomermis culicivorax TaxID=13658 RepID=A0A915HRW6_ROMCU